MAHNAVEEIPSEIKAVVLQRAGFSCDLCTDPDQDGLNLWHPNLPVVEADPDSILVLCNWCYQRETR